MKKNENTNIVTLYREYRDFTLWGALSGDFDLEIDQVAYNSLVLGDVASMKTAIKLRKASVGKPNFTKGSTAATRRHEASQLIRQELAR
jgi:hypothetical protein